MHTYINTISTDLKKISFYNVLLQWKMSLLIMENFEDRITKINKEKHNIQKSSF